MEAGTNESAAIGNMRMSIFWGQHKALAGVKPTSTLSLGGNLENIQDSLIEQCFPESVKDQNLRLLFQFLKRL